MSIKNDPPNLSTDGSTGRSANFYLEVQGTFNLKLYI